MVKGIQVAIDGPASAGKSTVAKLVAKRFGYIYCDTGAMYRSVTLAALERGIDLSQDDLVSELANQITITFAPGDPQKVFIDGHEVTQAIRSTEVAQHVSTVAAIPAVRSRMVELQRQIAQEGGIVMDGRDIGTTVLPDAPVKSLWWPRHTNGPGAASWITKSGGSTVVQLKNSNGRSNYGIKRIPPGRFLRSLKPRTPINSTPLT